MSSFVWKNFMLEEITLSSDLLKHAILPLLGIKDNAKFRIPFIVKLIVIFAPATQYPYLVHNWNTQFGE